MPSIAFITQGCAANQSDSEIMKGLLEGAGYAIADEVAEADLVVFNTCTVKGPTESFFARTLSELRDQKKRIVLAGCIPQSEKDLERFSDCSIIGPYQIRNIVPMVEGTLAGHTLINVVREHEGKLDLAKVRTNPLIEITQIASGCTDACAFCKTKYARGSVHSYRPREIRESIEHAVREGVREIWLASQDNGAYGKDSGTDLVELLKDLVRIEGDFRIRIGMANPHHVLGMLDELIWVIKENPKLFCFLHVPVQSGSNAVLKSMRRAYQVEDFIFIYKRLKEELPDISIANDIICAYPTETDEDFEKTVRLLEDYPCEMVNISRFWPRPGTPAAKLRLLPGEVMKARTRKMTETFHATAERLNRKWVGWEGEALVDEQGKDGTWVARNASYRPIIIKSNLDLFGKTVKVRVHDAAVHDLRAYLLEDRG